MSDPGSDYDYRRDRRRRHSSSSEEDLRRKNTIEKRRNFDRPQYDDRNGGRIRDGSRSDHRRRMYRSRSPRTDRARVKGEPMSRSRSPTRRPRDDDRKYSRRNYSASRSPPPKRRRRDSRDDNRRHSSYHSERRTSPSPRPRRHRHSPSPPPPPSKRSHAPLPSQQSAFSKTSLSNPTTSHPDPPVEKQKPNYAPTGKLAAETNTVANTSIVLKYNEPPESRLPSPSSSPWRLYIFKGEEMLETINLYERTCWLFGRERSVVDVEVQHPSCSKQHAVLQFRFVEGKKDEWGVGGGRKGGVRLYVIDLESANGTRLNGEEVPGRRYVEVRSGDVLRFGESTREYVLMLPPKDLPKG